MYVGYSEDLKVKLLFITKEKFIIRLLRKKQHFVQYQKNIFSNLDKIMTPEEVEEQFLTNYVLPFDFGAH